MEDRLDGAKSEVESGTLKGRRAGRGPYYVGVGGYAMAGDWMEWGTQSQGQGYRILKSQRTTAFCELQPSVLNSHRNMSYAAELLPVA